MKSLWVFLNELIADPKAMGAAYPSSKQLARHIAKRVPLSTQGKILELGPGTGVVTQALIEHGVPLEKMTLIERSEKFVDYLRQRFPKLDVIHGDAVDMFHLLGEKPGQVGVVVSSLPLLLLEETVIEKIEQGLRKVLQPNGLFIHFTYKLKNGQPYFSDFFRCIDSQSIWFNIPPARIEVYQLL